MVESGLGEFTDIQSGSSVNFKFTKWDYIGMLAVTCLLPFVVYLTIHLVRGGNFMDIFMGIINQLFGYAKDLLIIAVVVITSIGIGMTALMLSVRNTMLHEAREEITATMREALEYFLWRIGWVFTGSEKKIAGWTVGLVTVAALLAVTAQELNDGTWTLPWVIGVTVLLILVALGYCLHRENKTSLHQRY